MGRNKPRLKYRPPRLPKPAALRSRFRLIAGRWRIIITIATISSITTLCVMWWCHAPLLAVLHATPTSILGCLAVVVVLLWLTASNHPAAALGALNSFAYPPYWFGVATGVAAGLELLTRQWPIAVVLTTDDAAWISAAKQILIAPPAVLLLLSVLRRPLRRASAFAHRRRKPAPLSAEERGEAWMGISEGTRVRDQAEIVAWIRNDRAQTEGELDLFGASEVAARMSARLLAKPSSSQALIGALGTGKTTVRNLVHAQLESLRKRGGERVALVPIELWPFETTRGAVQGVLKSLIGEISREVGTLRISGLPDKYLQLIAAVSPKLSAVSRLFEVPSTPAEALTVLNEVARCIGIRYVLWVEDLERFAPADLDAPARDLAEAEKLAPLRALLHALDELSNIAVVTATTSLFTRFDLEKIARYVEKLGSLDPTVVRRTIKHLRDYWQERFSFLSAIPEDQRDAHRWSRDREELGRELGLGHEPTNVAEAVIALAQTPRTLKQILRGTDERWTTLHGEVDLDDVLAAMTLREATPAAFALLERDFDRLRYPDVRGPREKDETGSKAAFNAELEDVVPDVRKRAAVRVIIDAIFANPPPQGLARNTRVDYWKRFLAVPTIEPTDRDQVVIDALLQPSQRPLTLQAGHGDEARAFEPARVANLLIERAQDVENFSFLVSAESLGDVFISFVSAHIECGYSFYDVSVAPAGMDSVWRMFLGKGGNPNTRDVLISTIERCLELCITQNLAMYAQIDRWFLASAEGPELLDIAERDRLRVYGLEMLVSHFAGQPQLLANALERGSEMLLYLIAYRSREPQSNVNTAEPFPAWKTFRNTVLEAALDSDAALSAVAPFVTRPFGNAAQPNQLDERFEFDRHRAAALFDDVDLLLMISAAPGRRRSTPRVGALQDLMNARSRFAESLRAHAPDIADA